MFSLNCRGRLVILDTPLVMGIVNLTPDSFYEGSRFKADAILRQVEQMLAEGADIIDIGAQSTRPGSQLLSTHEELARISPIIEPLIKNYPDTIFSIDTFYSSVAAACINAGFSIINDVSGGEMDGDMLSTAASLKAPYICTHMRGTPQTMSTLNDYDNVAKTVLDYFIKKIAECQSAGVNDIIIDPGFGFSKNISQNFELLKNLQLLKILDKPILAGLSRKSTIYKTLNITAAEALNGTTSLNTVALMNGAKILRVHDVKEAKECIKLVSRLVDN